MSKLTRKMAVTGVGLVMAAGAATGAATSAQADSGRSVGYPQVVTGAGLYGQGYGYVCDSTYRWVNACDLERDFYTSSIRNIQRRLGVGQDGVIGSQTNAAIRNFQASHHLGVDGIVGVNTMRAMGLHPVNVDSIAAE